MFKIKDLTLNNNILFITDKYGKVYSTNINNSNISSLLPLASNRSASIDKNIKYMNKYFKVAMSCVAICAIGALTPVILGKYCAEVFVLMFGGLGMASLSLAGASKIYKKWLKKYSISNEYWEQIYNLLANKTTYESTKSNSINYSNSYNNSYSINNSYKKGTSKIDDSNECTYSYSKNQIIQDYDEKAKVKTYKRY